MDKLINNKIVTSKSFLETEKLGRDFAGHTKPGDVILLYGDLGSGKTTFVKGFLKGLEFSGGVTSPTFSLINEYEASKKVIHIDCYREENLQRWINLGIEDYFNGANIVIVEWPEILSDIIPDHAIKIKIRHIREDVREFALL
tara:strand:- start:377 stop:805 length:429 start_codon:yes stop_codon:yes gene_type:complete